MVDLGSWSLKSGFAVNDYPSTVLKYNLENDNMLVKDGKLTSIEKIQDFINKIAYSEFQTDLNDSSMFFVVRKHMGR